MIDGLGRFISIYVDICGACGINSDVSSVFLLEASIQGELSQKRKISGVDASVGCFCPWDFGGTRKSEPKLRRSEGVEQGEFRKIRPTC